MDIQEALGDQGVELIPADAENGVLQEGVPGQSVQIQTAGGDVLAAEKLLHRHDIPGQGRELLQPGQQGHDGDETHHAGCDAADEQDAPLLFSAQDHYQQHQADGGAQQLAPTAHDQDRLKENGTENQRQSALPIEFPAAGRIAAADRQTDEEDVIGVGAAVQGEAVASGHIVAQVA